MTKKVSKSVKPAVLSAETVGAARELLDDLRTLIDLARARVAQQVNTELVALYWHVGQKITVEILKQERAEYGKQVLETLGNSSALNMDVVSTEQR